MAYKRVGSMHCGSDAWSYDLWSREAKTTAQTWNHVRSGTSCSVTNVHSIRTKVSTSCLLARRLAPVNYNGDECHVVLPACNAMHLLNPPSVYTVLISGQPIEVSQDPWLLLLNLLLIFSCGFGSLHAE